MSMFAPLPKKRYQIIYADPPWAYRQGGTGEKTRGTAAKHYQTVPTNILCTLPVQEIVQGPAACFMWGTFPNFKDAQQLMEAWGFIYKTVAFVWVKKTVRGGNYFGMGAYTRANAEPCLLGITPDFKAMKMVQDHGINQIIEAQRGAHSEKPGVVRERITQLLGDLPRIELFARQTAPGWDSWGNEV